MTKDGIVDVYEQGWHGSIHGLRDDVEVIGFKDEWMFAKQANGDQGQVFCIYQVK